VESNVCLCVAFYSITNTGVGNKVVLRGFTRMPEIVEEDGNVLAVKAGEPCSVDGGLDTGGDVEGGDGGNVGEGAGSSSATSSMKQLLTFSMPFLMGRSIGISGGVGSALLTTLALTSSSSRSFVHAQSSTVTAECESVPIEVDIYVDSTAADIVMMNSKSGTFEVCPTETLYWEHHPKVFGGYSGCVGESVYMPCAQDSQGLDEEEGEFYKMYPLNWDGEKCVPTGYDASNRTYWVLWGHPSDKYELNLRTGMNPVVSFPFNRGPYPDYDIGTSLDIARDDSADARAMAKDLLVYIGAFTEAELEGYEVTFTEGAESGMIYIWAGKALDIARTTCNRDIYVLMEVPAYGYTPSDVAAVVNSYADTFYNSTECLCYETDSCKTPTVTVSNRGWLPLTPFPVELGGDNMTYAADSTSPSSPWMESMVFPENPTGKLKTTQLSADRRICDGVYLWPMYFGGQVCASNTGLQVSAWVYVCVYVCVCVD
jgi:hypothetical protein